MKPGSPAHKGGKGGAPAWARRGEGCIGLSAVSLSLITTRECDQMTTPYKTSSVTKPKRSVDRCTRMCEAARCWQHSGGAEESKQTVS